MRCLAAHKTPLNHEDFIIKFLHGMGSGTKKTKPYKLKLREVQNQEIQRLIALTHNNYLG